MKDQLPIVLSYIVLFCSLVVSARYGWSLAVAAKEAQKKKLLAKEAAAFHVCELLRKIANSQDNWYQWRTLKHYFPPSLVMDLHGETMTALAEHLPWMGRDFLQFRIRKAWVEFANFNPIGCCDAENDVDGAIGIMDRFKNQKAETVRQRLIRLAQDLENALK